MEMRRSKPQCRINGQLHLSSHLITRTCILTENTKKTISRHVVWRLYRVVFPYKVDSEFLKTYLCLTEIMWNTFTSPSPHAHTPTRICTLSNLTFKSYFDGNDSNARNGSFTRVPPPPCNLLKTKSSQGGTVCDVLLPLLRSVGVRSRARLRLIR